MNSKFCLGSILVLCLVLALLAAGCSSNADKAIEEVIGGLIEAENEAIQSESDPEATTDTDSEDQADSAGQIKVEQSVTWPNEMPAFVPPFDGKLTTVVTADHEDNVKNYTIAYENLKDISIDSYEKALISKGWNIDVKSDMGNDGWLIYAGHDSGAYLTAAVEPEDKSAILNVVFPE